MKNKSKITSTLYFTPSKTNEWNTPREITRVLGPFDLDPCAGDPRPWSHAKINWTERMNGLDREWFGRVWMNPPYSTGLIELFIDKFVEHDNGIALVFPRIETKWFQKLVKGSSLIFLRKGRIIFCKNEGSFSSGGILGNIFIARGKYNAQILLSTKWEGLYLKEIKI